MRFLTALLVAAFVAIPALAAARIFPGQSADGTYHYVRNPTSIHYGYIPTDGAGNARVCKDTTSLDEGIEVLQGLGFDYIVLDLDKAKTFFFSNPKVDQSAWPAEIVTVLLVDVRDKDFKGDVVYISGYDKNGCYWGEAQWERSAVVVGMKAIDLE